MQTKRKDESAKAFQAYCDYRDMGVSRSLNALHKRYSQYEVSKESIKPPSLKKNTIDKWSHQHDWQKRVAAWDNKLATSQTQSKADAIQELLDSELRDSKLQLDKWTTAFNSLPLHERQHRTVDDYGKVTEFVKLNYDDFHRMSKWRDDISKQYRRALNLPERVTQSGIKLELTFDEKTVKHIKAGEIGYKELAEEFDIDLATRLFRLAGVEVTEGDTSD